jgi:hypothetical protein
MNRYYKTREMFKVKKIIFIIVAVAKRSLDILQVQFQIEVLYSLEINVAL